MSKSVRVLIYLSSFSAPAGTASAGIQVTLSSAPPRSVMAVANTDEAQVAAGAAMVAEFDVQDLDAGSYGIEAKAIDTAGATIGSPTTTSVSLTANVPAETQAEPVAAPVAADVTVQVPGTISAVVS